MYIHTSTTGQRTDVHTDEWGRRFYLERNARMILPALPTTAAGRYNLQAMADAYQSRRAYRRFHDDYMLPTSPAVFDWEEERESRIQSNWGVNIRDLSDSIVVPPTATTRRSIRRRIDDGTWVHEQALDEAVELVATRAATGGSTSRGGIEYRAFMYNAEI